MLSKRHQDERLHREMCAAFTTAAVVNCAAFMEHDTPARAIDWMPSHPAFEAAPTEPTFDDLAPEHQQMMSDYNLRVLELAAEMKAAHARVPGPDGSSSVAEG